MLDKKVLVSFENMLIEHRAALLSQAAKTLKESCGDSCPQSGDFADIASQESNRTLKLRLREREQKLLAKIDKALAKLDRGVYGICEHCGGDISLERLRARPVATLCIECKQDQESEEV
ncbi:MAG TPA: TraR/DksA C4-type zinc finger protein [bacterium]|nr:TraR/DksA C4-type zinc finger protein [bacterium]